MFLYFNLPLFHAFIIAVGDFDRLPENLHMRGLKIADRSYLCYYV